MNLSMINVLIATSVFQLIAPTYWEPSSQEREERVLIDDHPVCDGFRTAIRKRYAELQHAQKINVNGLGSDISDLVSVYIPNGTTFSEAEMLLSNCGFKTSTRPGHIYENSDRPDRYDVDASSEKSIMKNLMWGMSVEVNIGLRPNSPDDYSAVKLVTAHILFRAL